MIANGRLSYSAKYNFMGNLTQFTNELNQKTEYLYTPDMFLKQINYSDGTNIKFTYDQQAGKFGIIGRAEAKNYIYYDSLGRIVKETDALGNETKYLFKEGKIHQKIDPDGNETLFTYNEIGLLKQIKYHTGEVEECKYDIKNGLFYVSNENSELVFKYDLLGQLVEVTALKTKKRIKYGYDRVGNRTSMTPPSDSKITYLYDSLNRIINIKLSDGRTAHYSYNSIGKIEQLIQFNGIKQQYSYDSYGRLKKLAFYKKSGELFKDITYQYDNADRIIKKNEGDNKVFNYEYNTSGYLTAVSFSEGEIRYSYDSNGNRVKEITGGKTDYYSYDKDDRLIQENNIRYEYDRRGNRIVKAKGTEKTIYGYNNENQLVKVILPGGKQIQYKYDPYGEEQ